MIAGCGSSGNTEVLLECASPDASNIATVYRVVHGERAADQALGINVRPAGAGFDGSMATFTIQYGSDAIVTWLANDRLQIDYPQHSVIRYQENVIFGTSQTFSPEDVIHVTYREMPSTHGYFITETRCFRGEQ